MTFENLQPTSLITNQDNGEEDIDLKKAFSLLQQNRKTYNAYNDSIFFFHKSDDWRKFFIRRAIRNHQIFLANQQILKEIKDYFSSTNPKLTAEKYEELYQCHDKLEESSLTDRFFSLEVCQILNKYYESGECPDSLNHLLDTKLLEAYTYHYIATILPDDTTYYAKAFRIFKEVLSNKNTNLSNYKATQFTACLDLTSTIWVQKKLQSIEEGKVYVEQMKRMLADSTYNFMGAKVRAAAKAMANSYTESIIRNVYLNDTTVMDSHKGDSIMRVIVAKNLALGSKVQPNSFYRTLIMQVHLKQKSAKYAFDEAQNFYLHKERKVLKGRLSDVKLTQFLNRFLTLAYLNDIADMPEERKRKNVLAYCHDIVTAYNLREDQQLRSGYIKRLYQLTTYQRITKYLHTKERIRFLEQLNVATQVSTYATLCT